MITERAPSFSGYRLTPHSPQMGCLRNALLGIHLPALAFRGTLRELFVRV